MVKDSGAVGEYLDFLVSTFPADLDLDGMKVVVDAANGAASRLARPLLERLGARVTVIGDKPDGRNINVGFGALAPGRMCALVKKTGAACGLALDGDADRVLFADEHGRLVSGDVLIGMTAAHLKDNGTLGKPKVVVTVMSNAGLERFLGLRGIAMERVAVGDRNVSVAMEKEGLRVGGENSGHVIFSRFSPSGDGLLTALQILAVLRATGRPLSWFRRAVPNFPQVLRNVPARRKIPLAESRALTAAVARAEKALDGGRVLLRYSGTEPLLRILVEGPRDAVVRRVARELDTICRKELNDHVD